jgi:rRNA maturation endonuclease Nob1
MIAKLRTRFSSAETYECELCSLSYERDLLNCPACGSQVVRKR